MKYNLKEPQRFTLFEKYTLNEADDMVINGEASVATPTQELLSKMNTLREKLGAKLDNINADTLNNMLTSALPAISDGMLNKLQDLVKGGIGSVLGDKFAETASNNSELNVDAIEKILNSIKAESNADMAVKLKKDLTDAINNLNSQIAPVEEAIKLCDEFTEKLKGLTDEQLKANSRHLTTFNTELTELINTVDSSTNLANIGSAVKNALSGLTDIVGGEETGKDNPDRPVERDWATEIGKADGTKRTQLFEEYYKEEFGANASKIKPFDLKFRGILLKNGFNEDENSMVYYFKHGGKDVLASGNITETSFVILNNGAAGSTSSRNDYGVSGKDLIGEGLLGEANLIFNKHLFELSAAEGLKYLSCQGILIGRIESHNCAFSDAEKTKASRLCGDKASLTTDDRENIKTYATALFCEPGDTTNGKRGLLGGKLKALSSVNHALSVDFTGEYVKEKTVDETNIKSLTKDLLVAVSSAAEGERVGDIFTFIAAKYIPGRSGMTMEDYIAEVGTVMEKAGKLTAPIIAKLSEKLTNYNVTKAGVKLLAAALGVIKKEAK